jgi:FtsZ-interacting cell division protein ZipA
MRIILLLIGILIILGIVADGLRRSWLRKRQLLNHLSNEKYIKAIQLTKESILEKKVPKASKSKHIKAAVLTAPAAPEKNLDLFEPQLNLFPAEEEPAFPPQEEVKELIVESKPVAVREEILMLQVLAYPGKMFTNAAIYRALVKYGCRFGERALFHRFLDVNQREKIYFSVAPATALGKFDVLDQSSSLKGIIFFMPIIAGHVKTFNVMLDTAKLVAAEIGGIICDEQRHPLSDEKIEKFREKFIHATIS